MKRWHKIITRHWRSKLMSLLLAVAIWIVIRRAIPDEERLPSPPASPAPQAHVPTVDAGLRR